MDIILDKKTMNRMLSVLKRDDIKIKRLKFIGKTTNYLYQVYNANHDVIFNCGYSVDDRVPMRLFVDGWCFGEATNITKSKNAQNIFAVCQAVAEKHLEIQK